MLINLNRGVSPFWNTLEYWHIWLHSKTSLWPGPWPSSSLKARENGLVTPSSLLPFVFVVIFPFVALQIEDKSTDLKWTRRVSVFIFSSCLSTSLFSFYSFRWNFSVTTEPVACCWHWAFEMKTQWDPAQLLEQFRHSMCWFNSHSDWPKPPLWCTCDRSNLPGDFLLCHMLKRHFRVGNWVEATGDVGISESMFPSSWGW